MRNSTPLTLIFGIAVAASPAAVAIVLTNPLPAGCSAAQVERMRPLLDELLVEPFDVSLSITDRECPAAPCVSRTEITATVTDRVALSRLREHPRVRSEQFGPTLVADFSKLYGRDAEALAALCTIEPFAANLRLSEGYADAAGVGPMRPGANSIWRRAIKAPDPALTNQSRFTVAVIDGYLRVDHEALPAVENLIIDTSEKIDSAGYCADGSCCDAALSGTLNNHPAWTIGTIAALERKNHEPIGLSRPKAILSIDPGNRSCKTPWAMATAFACALDRKAEVVHYAGKPRHGDDARDQYAPIMTRVKGSSTLLVMAAGNEAVDLDTCPGWPASLSDNALTVTAFAENGGTESNTGYGPATVDLGMPLGSVDTICNKSFDCYDTYGKTSAASAIVAGSVLLMSGHANFVNCSAPELGSLLMQFAVAPTDPNWRKGVSLNGGQLNLAFLHDVALDANGNPVDYCPRANPAP